MQRQNDTTMLDELKAKEQALAAIHAELAAAKKKVSDLEANITIQKNAIKTTASFITQLLPEESSSFISNYDDDRATFISWLSRSIPNEKPFDLQGGKADFKPGISYIPSHELDQAFNKIKHELETTKRSATEEIYEELKSYSKKLTNLNIALNTAKEELADSETKNNQKIATLTHEIAVIKKSREDKITELKNSAAKLKTDISNSNIYSNDETTGSVNIKKPTLDSLEKQTNDIKPESENHTSEIEKINNELSALQNAHANNLSVFKKHQDDKIAAELKAIDASLTEIQDELTDLQQVNLDNVDITKRYINALSNLPTKQIEEKLHKLQILNQSHEQTISTQKAISTLKEKIKNSIHTGNITLALFLATKRFNEKVATLNTIEQIRTIKERILPNTPEISRLTEPQMIEKCLAELNRLEKAFQDSKALFQEELAAIEAQIPTAERTSSVALQRIKIIEKSLENDGIQDLINAAKQDLLEEKLRTLSRFISEKLSHNWSAPTIEILTILGEALTEYKACNQIANSTTKDIHSAKIKQLTEDLKTKVMVFITSEITNATLNAYRNNSPAISARDVELKLIAFNKKCNDIVNTLTKQPFLELKLTLTEQQLEALDITQKALQQSEQTLKQKFAAQKEIRRLEKAALAQFDNIIRTDTTYLSMDKAQQNFDSFFAAQKVSGKEAEKFTAINYLNTHTKLEAIKMCDSEIARLEKDNKKSAHVKIAAFEALKHHLTRSLKAPNESLKTVMTTAKDLIVIQEDNKVCRLVKSDDLKAGHPEALHADHAFAIKGDINKNKLTNPTNIKRATLQELLEWRRGNVFIHCLFPGTVDSAVALDKIQQIATQAQTILAAQQTAQRNPSSAQTQSKTTDQDAHFSRLASQELIEELKKEEEYRKNHTPGQ